MQKNNVMSMPERFLEVHEEHKYLQRFKKAWVKRFKPTQMEPLFEGVDLANYLTALDRRQEAKELLHYIVDDVKFDGNYNIWTPVGCGIILLARLQRLDGDVSGQLALLDRLIEHNYRVDVYDGELQELLDSHDKIIQGALKDTQKWGSHKISRHLMGLNHFRETADSRFPHSGTYETEALEDAISCSYKSLKEKLF